MTDENNLDRAAPVVTVSFFRYAGFEKVWAMSQMQLAHQNLRGAAGLNFYKLMGSGAGNGFSLKPDFSVYALLGAWRNLDAAENFFASAAIFKKFQKHSEEIWTIYMHAQKAHGRWSGREPFEIVPTDAADDSPIAVITRASIKRSLMWQFWRDVPQASAGFPDQPGLIFAKGVGELPAVEQATFSLWRTRADMVNYAYKNQQHAAVIKKTRTVGWYSEELFAQFRPFSFNIYHSPFITETVFPIPADFDKC